MTVDGLFNMPSDAISNALLVNEIDKGEHTKLIKSLNSLHKHYGKYSVVFWCYEMSPLKASGFVLMILDCTVKLSYS